MCVLGATELWVNDVSVPVSGVAANVLALLACTPGRPVSVRSAVAGLWGERPPAGAARAIASYVSRLRRLLTAAAAVSGTAVDANMLVATRPAGYVLVVVPDAVDAARFEQLVAEGQRAARFNRHDLAVRRIEAARELWRGEPYADIPHAPFAAAERVRLQEVQLSAAETLFEARLEVTGADKALVAEVEALLGAHPFRERLWAQLMLALYREGRQGEALVAYHRARNLLVSDLGVEPGPDLREVERRILCADPGLDAVTREPAEIPPALDRPRHLCVGRESELAWLLDALDTATCRGSQIRLISGPLGIGKTRLLAELAHAAAAKVTTIAVGHNVVLPRAYAGAVLVLVDDADALTGAERQRITSMVETAKGAPVLVVVASRDPDERDFQSAPGVRLGPLSADAVGAVVCLYAPDVNAQQIVEAAGDSGGVPALLHRAAATWAAARAEGRIERAAADVRLGRTHLHHSQDEVVTGVLDLGRARSGVAFEDPVMKLLVCPYKGLARYERTDAALFFGRDRLIAELVARLIGAPLLAVIGASGTGKSSLVRAGLLPALAAGVLPDSAQWRQVVTTPTTAGDLRQVLDSTDLLIVDQLEEVFTAVDPAARVAFVRLLSDAADRHITIVLTMRSDFYDRCVELPVLAGLIVANHVMVGPLGPDELRQVITQPASYANLHLQDGLADVVLEDVRQAPGALPLLSTALLSLWERRDGHTLTLAAYRETGGVAGAVESLGERAYAQLPTAEHRQAARRILLRLAAAAGPGTSGGIPVRRAMTRTELLQIGGPLGAHVLDVFIAGRLLTVQAEQIAVAHEALLSRWTRLRDWLVEDATGRDLLAHLAPTAQAWLSHGRDRGELYRGARLAAASDWAATHLGELTTAESDFLAASQNAVTAENRQARRSIRRLRTMLTATIAASLLAATGATVATMQERRAEEASRFADAARLGAMAQTEPRIDVAALLAAQGAALHQSAETRSALLSALLRNPQVRRVVSPLASRVYSMDVAPDGRTIAVGDNQGRVALVDTATWQRRGPVLDIDAETYVTNVVSFSPDGRYVIGFTGNADDTRGVYGLWDVATGERLQAGTDVPPVGVLRWAPLGSPLTAVSSGYTLATWTGAIGAPHITVRASTGLVIPAGFSADGNEVLVADNAGWATWWAAATWTPIRRIPIGPRMVFATLSPNGRVVAVGDDSGTTRLRDARTGALLQTFSGQRGSVEDIRYDASGERVITAADDGTAAVWDTRTGNQLWSITDLGGGINMAAAFAPGSRDQFYVASHDGSLIDVNLADGPLNHHFTVPGGVSAAAWPSATGPILADQHATVSLWAPALSVASTPVHPLSSAIVHLARLPGSATAAAATVDGVLALLRRDGSLQEVLGHESAEIRSIATDADTVFAVLGNGEAVAYDTSSGAQRWRRRLGPADLAGQPAPGMIAADPRHGRLAVSFFGATVQLLDPASGDVLRSFTVESQSVVPAIAFDPDSGALIAGARDGTLRLFDSRSGQPLGPPIPGPPTVPSVIATGDTSGHAATLGGDGTVAIWEIASRQMLARLPTATTQVTSLAMAPDGESLLVGEAGGAVTIWDLNESSWIQAACRQANRQLTRDEWGRLLPRRGYAPAC